MITVTFRDGSKEVFKESDFYDRRPPRVEYHEGMVKIVDTWGGATSFPLDLVEKIEESAPPGRAW